MVSWVVYIAIGLIIGGAAGFFLGRLDDFSHRERKAMQDKLDQANKQMVDYRHDVTQHFIATAGLVNNLTESYQAVHEHLAKGAQSLCDHKVSVNRLEVTSASVIDSRAGENAGHRSNDKEEVEPQESAGQSAQSDDSINKDSADKAESRPEVSESDSTASLSAESRESQAEPAEREHANSASDTEPASPQEKPGTGAQGASSDNKPTAGDQNDLTMASRMVH